ncbi:CoaE Dephospho-CoA kinase [Candidatus Nanopelagicaceae bacterium]
MLIVALTGGIGAGKSQVAKYFHQLGSYVFDADLLARAAIERGSAGFDEVVATFGDVILKDGDIDRRKLGEIIFADPTAKAKLESIVHPEVQRLFEEAKKSLPADAIVIYEIPLLAESNSRSRFDYAITVESDEQTRTSRLKERGLASHEIVGRMAAQASREERISHCDLVIENQGNEDELLRQVEEIWQSVLLPLAKNHGK